MPLSVVFDTRISQCSKKQDIVRCRIRHTILTGIQCLRLAELVRTASSIQEITLNECGLNSEKSLLFFGFLEKYPNYRCTQ